VKTITEAPGLEIVLYTSGPVSTAAVRRSGGTAPGRFMVTRTDPMGTGVSASNTRHTTSSTSS